MKLTKILQLSFNMFLHSKLRSWLTILGIVIGVAAVVAIISVGNALQANVQSQISGLGQDIISISAGSSRAIGDFGGDRRSTTANPLSEKDVQALRLVPGIKAINTIVSGRSNIHFKSQNASLSIQGVNPAVFSNFITTPIESGRGLAQGDSRVIVIGQGVATNTFQDKLEVGYIILINNIPFRIVGILQSSSGFGGSDNAIYMTTNDARDVLGSTITLKNNEFSSISVQIDDPAFVQDVTDKIDAALMNSRHATQNNKDYTITSPLALQQRFSQVTTAITLFLGIIAAISLLVGGIGVANTMFTSVLEKTRDIGVMKAIGAKNSDILLIFLFNSGMLGLVGGIIGIIVGSGVASILPLLGLSGIGPGSRGGLQTLVSPGLLIFSLLFSILIGMISGVIPAYRASKLNPVEALRYE